MINVPDNVEPLSSKYLKNRILPDYIKLQVLLYSILLIHLNLMLFHRTDKEYYFVSFFGVLISLIPIKAKLKNFIGCLLAILLYFSNGLMFYVLYGFVLSSTYQTCSVLCLFLSQEVIDYLRKIEILFLIPACFIQFRFDLINFIISFLILFLSLFCKSPASENYKEDSKENIIKILEDIKKMYSYSDYCLIAEEHRLTLLRNSEKDIDYDFLSFFDFFLPFMLCNLNIILKAWIYVCVCFNFMRSNIIVFFLYVCIILSLTEIIYFLAPFCNWKIKIDNRNNCVTYVILARILTGYVLYIIMYFFIQII